MSHQTFLLNDQEISQLEDYLFSTEHDDTAMDFFQVSGLVTAKAIRSTEEGDRSIPRLLTGNDNVSAIPEEIKGLLDLMETRLMRRIEQDEVFDLPIESGEEFECLTNWCVGFTLYFLCDEAAWLDDTGPEVAELLFPILALSGLLEDEEPFSEILDDTALVAQMLEQLPENALDLYMTFHA